jgi:hypothetical protein
MIETGLPTEKGEKFFEFIGMELSSIDLVNDSNSTLLKFSNNLILLISYLFLKKSPENYI